MFWYKILTVVQMFQYYPKKMIIDTLMFRSMPDFVEILCFYSIALIWLPFFLPLWSRLNFIGKLVMIVGSFSLGQWLYSNFDFWGIEPLKAILVEQDGFYTFGQLQRGALIFLGLLIGDLYKESKKRNKPLHVVPAYCMFFGLGLLTYFAVSNSTDISTALGNIADNVGKHPFNLSFFCFSVGGALLVLGLSLIMNRSLQKILLPISYLGKHSLNAFILHIIIIFYLYRYYFDLHHKVTYYQSLGLTGLCIVGIIFSMYFWRKTKTVFA